jgi:hypothetical protein
MKTQRNNIKNLFAILLLVLCFNTAQAQDDKAAIRAAIEAKQFVFQAYTMVPGYGSIRQLGGDNYNVKLAGDSLISYLPYFGRAYTAPVGTQSGLRFTSTAFDYTIRNKKKGGWAISIKPKDVTDVREFSLSVSETGHARLLALSNNRQPVSFNGKVAVVK